MDGYRLLHADHEAGVQGVLSGLQVAFATLAPVVEGTPANAVRCGSCLHVVARLNVLGDGFYQFFVYQTHGWHSAHLVCGFAPVSVPYLGLCLEGQDAPWLRRSAIPMADIL